MDVNPMLGGVLRSMEVMRSQDVYSCCIILRLLFPSFLAMSALIYLEYFDILGGGPAKSRIQ